jgi:2-dehydropantoate 2-reductase
MRVLIVGAGTTSGFFAGKLVESGRDVTFLLRKRLFGASATMQTKLFGAMQGAEVITPAPHEVDIIKGIYTRIVEKACASEEEYS